MFDFDLFSKREWATMIVAFAAVTALAPLRVFPGSRLPGTTPVRPLGLLPISAQHLPICETADLHRSALASRKCRFRASTTSRVRSRI